ncbi:alpha-1,4-glucan--maltose-1-phosphate maltosyltransferase [Streptomyces sp. CA-111067]|uniref:alpha-1,4-glucan--maltose-1-phosphate maltosyltransferase n=1 Tax=Streptomyces sp. CA-111067 TaxID=3240046 RepID=UPI003D9841B3
MSGRLAIDNVSPNAGYGDWPTKAVVGEQLPVAATVWREGHGALGVAVRWSGPGRPAQEVPMVLADPGADRFAATVVADAPGRWTLRVLAWGDPWATWCAATAARLDAGAPLTEVDLAEGGVLLDRLAGQAAAGARPALRAASARLRDPGTPPADRARDALSAEVAALAADRPLRELVTEGRPHHVDVDRERALFGSWYEFFPRSTGGTGPDGRPVHGTFRTAARELPRIAAMGFDVVYLPPVHPIGTVHRKGRNNALTAERDDVGSPWAIGSADGGHDSVHPLLGTLADFRDFTARAAELGLEVALDLALQCAPDHPWVREHPEWFVRRPDGSVASAENPPKRYEDIYPLDFDGSAAGLRAEVLRVVQGWIGCGVRIFRVDNPHTKPPDFWHWLIRTVKDAHPDVLFLAEAFTRPAVLHGLAKRGFTQSYTYFTWRETKQELTEYLTELVGQADWLRPNFFVNTPDILPGHLRDAAAPVFAVRAALAGLLSPSWGVYAGFELYEGRAVAPGSEEYLDSEKYQLRHRDFAAALAAGRSLEPWITVLNRLRRDHPALRGLRTLRFHPVDNDALIAFSKTDPGTGDAVLCVVTLDPRLPQQGRVRLDPELLGSRTAVRALDEVTGAGTDLGPDLDLKIDPHESVAHVFTWRNR